MKISLKSWSRNGIQNGLLANFYKKKSPSCDAIFETISPQWKTSLQPLTVKTVEKLWQKNSPTKILEIRHTTHKHTHTHTWWIIKSLSRFESTGFNVIVVLGMKWNKNEGREMRRVCDSLIIKLSTCKVLFMFLFLHFAAAVSLSQGLFSFNNLCVVILIANFEDEMKINVRTLRNLPWFFAFIFHHFLKSFRKRKILPSSFLLKGLQRKSKMIFSGKKMCPLGKMKRENSH